MMLPAAVWTRAVQGAARVCPMDSPAYPSFIVAWLNTRGWIQTVEKDPRSWAHVRMPPAVIALGVVLGFDPPTPDELAPETVQASADAKETT